MTNEKQSQETTSLKPDNIADWYAQNKFPEPIMHRCDQPKMWFESHQMTWDQWEEFLEKLDQQEVTKYPLYENNEASAGLNHAAQSTSSEGLCTTPAKRTRKSPSKNPKKLGFEGQSPRPAEGAEKSNKKEVAKRRPLQQKALIFP